ncbi:MAG: hypothetical protein AAGJ18_16115 [Bacteroidota bacterium]
MLFALPIIIPLLIACKTESPQNPATTVAIDIKNGHIVSEYQFSNNLTGIIALESGFPKIVLDERFANQLLLENKALKKMDSASSIFTWGDKKPLDVAFTL